MRENRLMFESQSAVSQELWERALGSLPGGNTRTTIFHDPHPVYVTRGEGCRVWDADGVERIDFISNYTSLILGHCHPRVVEAVQSQAARLMSVAAPNELEIELAERLRERLPSVELVRFTNSGTEATMLALRAARAFTGREQIGVFAGGYHGSHDYAASIPGDLSGAPGGRGIPAAVADTVVVAPFDDREGTLAAFEPHLRELGGCHRRAGAGCRRRRARDRRLPRVPPRADARRRRAARLRRGHLVPHRVPRRSGTARSHSGPDDAGQDHRRRAARGRARRPGRRDGALRPAARRPHRPRRHVQREPADDGRGPGDARRADAGALRRARGACGGAGGRRERTNRSLGDRGRLALPDRSARPVTPSRPPRGPARERHPHDAARHGLPLDADDGRRSRLRSSTR